MTDLVIRGVDEKFAEMVKNIHRAFLMRMKCAIQIDLSGNPNNFSYIYLNVHPDNASKLVRVEMFKDIKND